MRRGTVPDHLPDALVRLPTWEATRDAVLLRLPSVGRFLASATGDVVVEPAASATDADLDCFERGPVAAARLLLAGRFALRASAVAIDGRAVAICGSGAAGASTVAASLALRGHAVLADAVTEVTGAPPVVPSGAAEVELWPDAWTMLGLDGAAGREVRPALAKRSFRLGAVSDDVPLGLVVVLHPSGRTATPVAEPVTGTRKAQALFGHEWHGRLIEPLGLDHRRFAWLTGVAGAVAMVRIERPRRWDRPELLADLVEAAAR